MLRFVEVMASPGIAFRQLVVGAPRGGSGGGGTLRVMLMVFGVVMAGVGWLLYRSAVGERSR
jgi:hypothetical protein